MTYRLLHKKSNVLDKKPTSEQLEYGELAINYNAESPQLYIKNSSNNIVNFINENKIEEKIEVVRGKITNVNSQVNETKESLANLKENLRENEEVTASALNVLNKKNDETKELIKTVEENLRENEETTTSVLNDLNAKNNEITESLVSLEETVKKNEETTTYALNDLNKKNDETKESLLNLEENIREKEENTTSALNDLNKKNNEITESLVSLKENLRENEEVTASALNVLNKKNDETKESLVSLEENIKNLKTINVTYNELKDLYENNNLIIGSKYRITDYVTTTSQADTRSANHQFDIIVEATSTNTINENAKAVKNSNDSYFEGNKLDAWEIKYCFDNDTSRFAWADTTNGKGVIYYMKDEFNNEVWYDFKNIQFLRSSQWFKDNPKFITTSAFTQNTYFYTFSVVDNGVIKDDTLYTTKYHATDNHLGRNTAKITKLNNTIFIDNPNNGVFNNIISDGHGNNTFGESIWNNTIAHNCLNNIISKNFQYNDISSNFKGNHSWGDFAYNTIEAGCVNNRFLGNVTKCTFKQAYSNNNFTGETLSQCTFGMGITYISDMPSMTNVTFGNNCVSGSTSIYLNNLKTITGNNLLSVIQGFNAKFDYTILLTDNDKYNVFSHNIINKISNIHDLGSFEKSGDAENAAKNPNIGTNANISLMKYYVPSLNKTGIIEQMVGPNETTQFITWDGLRKFRKLQYINIGGNMSLINNPPWEEIKFISSSEWNNRLSGSVTTSGNQTITGKKQFNDGINISDKSFITSSIDSGELKVLHNNSTKGFIIRTKNTSDSILPLELLSTNGSASYQYDFPSKGGKIAMIDDVNNVKIFTKNSVNESLVNALKFDEIESGTKTFETSSIKTNFKVVYLSDMNRFAAKSLILTNPKYYVTWPSYNDYPSSNSYKSYSLTDELEFYGPIVGKFYLYQGDLCVWDGNEFQVKFYSKEQVDLEINNLKNLISENEEVTAKTLINLNKRLEQLESN